MSILKAGNVKGTFLWQKFAEETLVTPILRSLSEPQILGTGINPRSWVCSPPWTSLVFPVPSCCEETHSLHQLPGSHETCWSWNLMKGREDCSLPTPWVQREQICVDKILAHATNKQKNIHMEFSLEQCCSCNNSWQVYTLLLQKAFLSSNQNTSSVL